MINKIGELAQFITQFIAQIPRKLFPIYTWATRPDAASYSWGFIFITDIAGGALFRSTGSRWVPVSGKLVVRQVNTDITTSATTAEVALDQYTMPAGLGDNNHVLTCEIRTVTSASTNGKRLYLRGGGTGTDGSILSQANIGVGSTVASWHVFGYLARNSATLKKGFGGGVSGQGTTAFQNVSLDSSAAVDYYVTAQKDATGDTLTTVQIRWIYERGSA